MKIKSGFPFFYFLWLFVSIAFFFILLFTTSLFLFSLISAVIVAGALYLFVVNKYCLLSLEGSILKLKYLFPRREKIEIDMSIVKYIEFELSFFYLFAGDLEVNKSRMHNPTDAMTIRFKDGTKARIIDFNSPLFSTIKIYRYLKRDFNNSISGL